MMARGTGIVQADAERAARWLSGHLRYLQYRQRSPQEAPEARRVFSATHDQVRHSAVLSAMIGERRRQVVVHKLMLSAEEERVADWRCWTRQVMRHLAERQGQSLCWFGVLHQNTTTPHVHIVLTWVPVLRPLAPYTALLVVSPSRHSIRPSAWANAWVEERSQGGAEQESHP